VHEQEAVFFSVTVIVLAGVAVLWMSMHYRRRYREMAHRERLAMIERGLVPSPEVDPERFERETGLQPPESRAAARSRSLGVIMIGLGLGFVVLITFAAESPRMGIGIGGAFALLGAAFLVNSTLMSRPDAYQPMRRADSARRPPVEPPAPPRDPA
jgi:hypothetical protein